MIKIICVGKVKDKNLKNLIDDYLLKINHYHKIQVIEVKDEPIRDNDDEVLRIEGQRILSKIEPSDYVITCDLFGKSVDSISLSKKIDKVFINNPKLVFIIGGSLGLSNEVRKRSNELLKLSDLTFLHQMTRLILLEQIYRSYKIIHNETYHK